MYMRRKCGEYTVWGSLSHFRAAVVGLCIGPIAWRMLSGVMSEGPAAAIIRRRGGAPCGPLRVRLRAKKTTLAKNPTLHKESECEALRVYCARGKRPERNVPGAV